MRSGARHSQAASGHTLMSAFCISALSICDLPFTAARFLLLAQCLRVYALCTKFLLCQMPDDGWRSRRGRGRASKRQGLIERWREALPISGPPQHS